MSNQYYSYQSVSSSSSSQQYSPPISNGVLMDPSNQLLPHPNMTEKNNSPTFNNYDLGSSVSSISSMSSGHSYHNPRLRYYLSKSFDIEDDLEFCPEINSDNFNSSPTIKKFNPYTASVFSPTSNPESSPVSNNPQSPRVNTPRIRKPIEIINPQTKMRVASPATSK